MQMDDLWNVVMLGKIIKLEEGCRIIEFNGRVYKINESTIAYLEAVYINQRER